MTINFHKKTGKPTNVTKGHSAVWFSNLGLYVADNNGTPRLITAGTSSGTTTPVGVPSEPNMLYFNELTKKHFISTKEKWVEIPTAAIPGSGGGAGNASNVMITDPGNWYTSHDVEGALGEVGERLPHILGSGLLPSYGGNTFDIKTATEYLINTTSTNKPSTTTSWLTSRKASNGDIYGLAIDKNGDAFSRVNSSFVKLARRTEIDSANQAITNLSNKFTNDMLAWKVKNLAAGTGVTVSNNGQGAYTVGLDTSNQNAINLVKNNTYVKKNGDTMTNNLTVVGGVDTGIVYVRDKGLTNYFGLRARVDRMGLYDYGRNRPLIDYFNGGTTLLYGYGGSNEVSKFYATSKIDIQSTSSSNYPVAIRGENANSALSVVGKHSRHLFGGNETTAWIDVSTHSGAAKNLEIGTIGGGKIPRLKLQASNVHIEGGKLTVTSGILIGSNQDGNGPIGPGDNGGAKLYMYPYRHNGTVAQRQRYAGIGYSATDNTVTIHSAERIPAGGYKNYTNVKVVAGGFVTKSSEAYKDIHGEFEQSVLSQIMDMKPYIYNYKGSTNKELGFVIERNVPQLLQHDTPEEEGKGLSSYSLVAYLWKGVQELAQELEELKQTMSKK